MAVCFCLLFRPSRHVLAVVPVHQARMLNNQERGAIVEYFSAIQGGSEKNAQSQVPLTDPLHPSFQRALDVLRPFFEDFIIQPQGQRLLVDEDKFSKVLDLLPPAPVELRDTVAESWANKDMTASRRWRVLVNEVQRCMDAFSKQVCVCVCVCGCEEEERWGGVSA